MKYGLIGEKLGHSFSAEIHNKIGLYDYELRELPPCELEDFMRSRDFTGINVTIPYKQAVIPCLDEISGLARQAGAVNTVVNRGGRLIGYNTDCAGLELLIRRAGIDIAGKKTLIAGSGGTSRTAAVVAEDLGASAVFRMSRRTRCRGAAETVITYEEAYADHSDAKILINTTPAGMYPDTDGIAVDIDRLPDLEGIIDVVYNPLTTRLVSIAREKGLPAENGLYMLVAQAVLASELFTGKRTDEKSAIAPASGISDTIDTIYSEILAEKRRAANCI